MFNHRRNQFFVYLEVKSSISDYVHNNEMPALIAKRDKVVGGRVLYFLSFLRSFHSFLRSFHSFSQ